MDSPTRSYWMVQIALLACIVAGASRAQTRDTSLPAATLKNGEAQLFVDDFLIAAQTGVHRTLRQPKKDHGGNEPVIAIDDEFGQVKSTLEANGTILYDPKLKKWVMFTLAFASSWPGPSADRVRMYRFTSQDAIDWVKGDDNRPQRIEFDLHDSASNTSATNIDLFSCMYDSRDSQQPYKGWLFFANWGAGREGTYYVSSADGIHWQRGPQVLVAGSRTIQQDGRTLNGTGDVTTFYYDDIDRRFLGCLRWASATDTENTNRLRSRGFIFADRLDRPIDLNRIDRLSLVPEGAQRNGDMPTDEYYSSTAWRYGSLWLGGLRIWHSRDNYAYSASGCAFMKLIVSRDGLHWKKVPFANNDGHPEVFLPNGPEGARDGRNDGGYMTEFSNPPLRIGDQSIWYYGSSSWGKNQPRDYRVSGGGVFRARMRPDGFVSVDSGSLVTRRLNFEGRDLGMNSVGPITVEVVTMVDDRITPIATAHISGDSLNHHVIFDNNRSLRDVVPDGAVQLRFSIGEGGALYSFVVQNGPGETAAKRARSDEVVAISPAKKDDNGFLIHDVSSTYQSKSTQIRVLRPDKEETSKKYPVVYILPVEAETDSRFGDSLQEVKRRDLHNTFGTVFVAPTFSQLPWYADHPTRAEVRQESYFVKVVVPYVDTTYPVETTAHGRLLLGFSKSGWGAWSLLLRHPDLFGKAAAWDAPLAMDKPGKYGSGDIFGTADNFEGYRISKLLEEKADKFRHGNHLLLLGYGSFRSEHVETHALLERLKIAHEYRDGPSRKHDWHSGWVKEAVELLLADQ